MLGGNDTASLSISKSTESGRLSSEMSEVELLLVSRMLDDTDLSSGVPKLSTEPL